MPNIIKILFISIFIIYGSDVSCKTSYFLCSNGFGDFGKVTNSKIINNNLVLDNYSDSIALNIMHKDTLNDFSFEVRIANFNNIEGKSYPFITKDHTIKKCINPKWGIIWNYCNSLNYDCLSINCSNSNMYDLLDERFAEIEIQSVRNGTPTIMAKKKLHDNINLSVGYNVIKLDRYKSKIFISIGNKHLRQIFSIADSCKSHGLGFFAGAAAKVAVERIIVEQRTDMADVLTTTWTKDLLDKYLLKSDDILEGYWDYLDRNINNEKIRLGGKYRLAIIKGKNDDYDIIYISGAKTNGYKWNPGMIKGKLIATRFINHFNLIWYDAMMNPFDKEVSGSVIDNVILKLDFPLNKASIRFSKALK